MRVQRLELAEFGRLCDHDRHRLTLQPGQRAALIILGRVERQLEHRLATGEAAATEDQNFVHRADGEHAVGWLRAFREEPGRGKCPLRIGVRPGGGRHPTELRANGTVTAHGCTP